MNLSTNKLKDFNNSLINTTKLDLSNNLLKRIVFSDKNILEILILDRNKIDLTKNYFSKLDQLKYLSVSYNDLTIIGSDMFNGLNKLESLYLSDNKIKILNKNCLLISTLIYLNLNRNNITHVNSGAFNGLTHLQQLHLEQNRLRILDSGFEDGLDTLKLLNLYNNPIRVFQDNIPALLVKVDEFIMESNYFLTILKNKVIKADLSLFYLRYQSLFTIKKDFFRSVPNAKIVYLGNNNIRNIENDAFISVKSIQRLFLKNNNLVNITLNMFNYLQGLFLLSLSNNQISFIQNGSFDNNLQLYRLYIDRNNLITIDGIANIIFKRMNDLNLNSNLIKIENGLNLLNFIAGNVELGKQFNKKN